MVSKLLRVLFAFPSPLPVNLALLTDNLNESIYQASLGNCGRDKDDTTLGHSVQARVSEGETGTGYMCENW